MIDDTTEKRVYIIIYKAAVLIEELENDPSVTNIILAVKGEQSIISRPASISEPAGANAKKIEARARRLL